MEYLTSQAQKEFSFSQEQFVFLSELLKEKTGIVIAQQKKDMMSSRLSRRMRALKFSDFSQYCDLLKSSNSQIEMPLFINTMTTNLTKFFRENHHFEHLSSYLKNINNKDKRLRIWSAGCSSGMEPYSIAMIIKENLPNFNSWDVKILATDVDLEMLSVGRAGEYKKSDFEEFPEVYSKYLVAGKDEDFFSMRQDLKEMITFNYLNLIEEWPIKTCFDIIFCRNVVIYFSKETKKDIFNRMANILKLGSFVYIGHSESMQDVNDRFEVMGRTIYRRIN